MITVHDCADYIIYRTTEDESGLNLLKLQKLAYYCQAWHLAHFDGEPLFEGRFEAWVHGPVNVALYGRFRNSHSLYSAVRWGDMTPLFDPEQIDSGKRELMDAVLDKYAGMSGSQLEDLTHGEDPWKRARGMLSSTSRCTTEIDEGLMAKFYAARVS